MRKAILAAACLLLLPAVREAGAAGSQSLPTPVDCAPIEDGGKESYLSRIWELGGASRRQTFALTPYRSNYLLPFTYNGSVNEDPIRAVDPDGRVLHQEVQFQISVKVKLWEDIFGRKVDLWAAYTQRSFWQFYDFDGSAPFRETDFEPELLLNVRTDYRMLGLRGRILSVGLDHQSNGRAGSLSRSWNRLTATAGFERGNFVLLLRGWYRIPEREQDDDNPGIERYLGYGEVELFTFLRGCRFGLLWRNNLRGTGNRGAVQLTASVPLLRQVSGYLLYFNGYGESLLDYNASSNRIGVGFVLKEW